RALALLPLSR
nr:Chain B, Alkaline phosphatase peptide [Escherichia coli K-12]